MHFDKDYSVKLGTAEVAHVYYFGKASTGGDVHHVFPGSQSRLDGRRVSG